MVPNKVEKKHKTSDVLIGSVDCTDGPPQEGAGGPPGGGRNPLCDKYKVSGLPTLMYFQAGSKKGFTYEGNQTVDALTEFADELNSPCTPTSQGACTENQTAWFAEYEALSTQELKDKVCERANTAWHVAAAATLRRRQRHR